MFYRLREFADGIGSMPTAALGLLAGAAVGTLVTVQMSGGTPYSQADLDRVASHGRAAAAHARVKPAADVHGQAARLDRLQQRNEQLAGRLSAAQTTIADLRDQLDTAASAAASAPASPAPAPASAASASAMPSNGAAGLKITGTLDVSWVLTSAAKPWPASCSEIGSGYRVQVNTSDHAKVTLGVPTTSHLTGRSAKDGILTVSCEVMYSATLPSPLSPVYELVVVSADAPETPLDSAVAQAPQLVGGKVPPLGVTYCPDCPAQG